MLKSELKKLLISRKGAILIAVFFLLELVGMLLFTKPNDKELEAHREVYESYLAPVEGALTPEKREWIESEMLRLNKVHAEMGQLKSEYYSGNISEEEYRTRFELLRPEDEKFPGFSKLYTQYIYVREADNRFFLYTGGWEVLLGNQTPDYLFLVLLVFLLTPVFCQEYDSQMEQILLTQKRSSNTYWLAKLLAALLTVFFLVLILQIARLLLCAVHFGLPHGNFSLQSLVTYGNTQKSLTLWQAFAFQFAVTEIGYLYVAVILLFFSVLFQKFHLVVMAGLVSFILPFLTMSDYASLIRIPGPWAFTLGSVYLNSSVSYLDSQTGKQVTVFSEVSWGELAVLLAAVAVICALLILYIKRKNTNYHSRPKEKCLAALSACFLALLLCGCQRTDTPITYNTGEAHWFENGQYLALYEDMGTRILYDKASGKVYSFPLDAFSAEMTYPVSPFFYQDGKLYYIRAFEQYQQGSSESPWGYYALSEIDMQTMQESSRYTWHTGNKWFFGLLDWESEKPDVSFISGFFLHGNDMYFLINSDLFKMNLTTGKYETYLSFPNSTNYAYDGENLYYTDSYNRLVIHNLDSGEETALEDVIARDFVLTPEGIYYLNQRDNATLYFWNETLKAGQKLDDTSSYALHWDENYCWLESGEGLIRMNHDGSGRVAAEIPGYLFAIAGGNTLYSIDYMTGILYRVDKTTFAWKEIPTAQ